MTAPVETAEQSPYHMYWTGGWDSTYQLLVLTVEQLRIVQPHYVLEEERRSALAEVRAIAKLKRMIFDKFPHTRDLILPTRLLAVSDLRPDTEVDDAYTRLKERFPALGSQYIWMAKYCAQQDIGNMAVCAEKAASVSGPAHVYSLLRSAVEPINDHDRTTYRVPSAIEDRDLQVLFGRYLLPLLDTTKLEMAAVAGERDWNGIMGKTWFCHFPTRRMKPCGRCNPCLQVVADGLGWRLPRTARIASLFSRGY